uniref:RNase H type-1 domain-containing protein n=1 Tax=Oryza brachyantha TaxID=4533 RepID=J3L042_ORYBR
MLKAVVQAIPNFVMICEKMHWKSWEWLSTPKFLGGMGFRDFVLFNQAMLGKQGWRLVTDPDSLCSRVLKGRYFPTTSFWDAAKPRSASFTWRSILFGRDLLKKGVRWGVGDGRTIKILADNWIPANVILEVPISRHGGDDFASWPHDRRGLFTKVFWWLKVVVVEVYPLTCTSMKETGRVCGNQCSRDDHSEHVFLLCPFAVAVWEEIKSLFGISLDRGGLMTLRLRIFEFLSRNSGIHNTVLAVTIWHIWEARNNARNNGRAMHPRRVAQRISGYVEMIVLHCSIPGNASRCDHPPSVPSWDPPPAGTVLINIDAALFQTTRQMGMCVLIRDHNGDCLLASNERAVGILTPEIAEAWAIRRALTIAKEEGLQRVIVASDCLPVIQKLQTPVRDRSRVGCLVEDIKKIGAGMNACSFIHVSRLCNVEAYTLAHCSEHSVCNIYRNETPEFGRCSVLMFGNQ